MRAVLSILILLPILSYGQQNLVPNGGFEDVTDCPWTISLIDLAIPWTNSGGGGTPDLYAACAPPLIVPPDTLPLMGVPANSGGVQAAHSGEGYAGIYTYGGSDNPEGREYLQVKLNESLYASIRYKVSFCVSLADRFQYAIGSFGAYFSDSLIIRENWNVLDVEPTIQSPIGQVFEDKENWELVTDTFVSRYGGEEYLVIGNFKTAIESDTVLVPTGALNQFQSYYYIDDVSVIALDSIPTNVGIAETQQLGFSVYPNPATDVVRIKSGSPLAQVRLFDVRGREAAPPSLPKGEEPLRINVSGLPPGIYFIEVTDTEGRKGVKKLMVQ